MSWVPLCQYIKTDGVRCGSPAMRGQALCFYHSRTIRPQPRRRKRDSLIKFSRNTEIILPALDSPEAVNLAVGEVMQAVLDQRIDADRANSLLYALQTASLNLDTRGSLSRPLTLYY